MKITPLEIRQKTFEKVFRGLDKDEVQGFLLSLSQEWEKVLDENKLLRIKLEAAEKEVQKLRDVESSLFKTLKTAEDTGTNLIEQATREAELKLKESVIKSDEIVTKAKDKAKDIISNAENKSRQILENMIEKVKELEKQYENIENLKDDLLSGLKGFSKEVLDKLQKFEGTTRKKEFKGIGESARNVYNEGIVDVPDRVSQPENIPSKEESPKAKEKELNKNPETTKGEEKSFFDELE